MGLTANTSAMWIDISSGLFGVRQVLEPKRTLTVSIQTQYGLLDPNPTVGERILSRNYGRSPGQISVNLRLAKTFSFGPDRGCGGSNASASPRYGLPISLAVRNLLNHTNPGPITSETSRHRFSAGRTKWRAAREVVDSRKTQTTEGLRCSRGLLSEFW